MKHCGLFAQRSLGSKPRLYCGLLPQAIFVKPASSWQGKRLTNLANLSMETLEFIIYPDGRVKEAVTGIVGASCAEVTAAIEAQLGVVVSQQTTSDYYNQPNQQTIGEKASSQVSYSQW